MKFKWPLVALALLGCGGPGTRPEDMSAAGHEEAARSADRISEHYQLRRYSEEQLGFESLNLEYIYQGHAEAHRLAATELRAGEVAACQKASAEERATCPLLGRRLREVELMPSGVRVVYADADAAELQRHVDCHHAFGAAVGRDGMSACPLYTRALRIDVQPAEGGGAVLNLESEDEATRRALWKAYTPRGAAESGSK